MAEQLDRHVSYFRLDTGREICLDQLHIERSALGVLEGTFEIIRSCQLAAIPERAHHLFGGHIAFTMKPPPPEGELPTYVFFADLTSHEPVRDGIFSWLVACWFVDRLPTELVCHVSEAIRAIDWDELAIDGDY
jgi:hypothetical protein